MEHVWLCETFFGSWPAESEHGIFSTHFVNAQGAHPWPFRFNYCLCVRKCFAFLRGCLVAPQVFKSRFTTQPVVLGSQLRGFGQTLTGMVLIAINAFAQFPSDVWICWLKTSVENRLQHQTDAALWQLRTCWKHSRKPCLFKLVGTHSKPCQNTEFGRLNSVVFIHAWFFADSVQRFSSWCSFRFFDQSAGMIAPYIFNSKLWRCNHRQPKISNDWNFHIVPLWPFLNKCRQVQKSASRLLLAGGTHSAVELTDHGAPLEAGFRQPSYDSCVWCMFGEALWMLYLMKVPPHIFIDALRSSHQLPRFWLLGMGPSCSRDRWTFWRSHYGKEQLDGLLSPGRNETLAFLEVLHVGCIWVILGALVTWLTWESFSCPMVILGI